LILGAVVILSKFYNDVYYSNNYIACQYNINLRVLNEIERQFCKIISYNIYVSQEEFEWYVSGLLFHNNLEFLQMQQIVASATQPAIPHVCHNQTQAVHSPLQIPLGPMICSQMTSVTVQTH
jgi:hypothetical protein